MQILRLLGFRKLAEANYFSDPGKLAALAFVLGMLYSWSAWGMHSDFPSFPLFNLSINLTLFISGFVKYLLLISLLTYVFLSNKVSVILIVISFMLLVIQDQIRLQPWAYFYVLVIIGGLFCKTQSQYYRYLSWLMGVMYLWAGWHKFNPYFFDFVFAPILKSYSGYLFQVINHHLRWIWVLVPFLEMAMGLMLLMRKKVKTTLCLGVIMHLGVIVYLIGIQYNYVVIPWNLAMIAMLCLLSKQQLKSINSQNLFLPKAIVALVMILPLVPNFDKYLSFHLYSGKTPMYFVQANRDLNSIIDKSAKAYQQLENGYSVDVNLWCMKTTGLGYCSEPRHVEKLYQWLLANEVENSKIWKCTPYYLNKECEDVTP